MTRVVTDALVALPEAQDAELVIAAQLEVP